MKKENLPYELTPKEKLLEFLALTLVLLTLLACFIKVVFI